MLIEETGDAGNPAESGAETGDPGSNQQIDNTVPTENEGSGFMEKATSAANKLLAGDDADGDPDPPEETGDNSEEESAETDPEKPAEERTARSTKYKQLQEQADSLSTFKADTEKQLESIGGVEGLNDVSKLLAAFMAPEGKIELPERLPDGTPAVDSEGNPLLKEITGTEYIQDFVADLPNNQQIYSGFFIEGLQNENNRVFALNETLKGEFNMRADANLSLEQYNKVFDLLAAKVNMAETPEEINSVFSDFEMELRGLDYDSEISVQERRIKELEDQLAAKSAPAGQEGEKEVDPIARMQETIEKELESEVALRQKEDEYLVTRYTETAKDIFESRGLAIGEKDPPELKSAKETLQRLILGSDSIAARMRQSAAFNNVAGFIKNEKLDSRVGTIAHANFTNAMRVAVNDAIKTLSPLFQNGAIKPREEPPGEDRSSLEKDNETLIEESFRARAESAMGSKLPKY